MIFYRLYDTLRDSCWPNEQCYGHQTKTDGLREKVIYREAPHPKLCWFESHEPAPQHAASGTGCSGKIVFLSQFTATSPSFISL